MTRAVLDQPALWDEPAEPARPPRRPTHTPRPRRTRESQAEPCEPSCLVCGKAEGRGLCSPRCSVTCVHVAQADLVEVCLVTVHVTARVVVGIHGFEPGRKIAVVTCPFCTRVHWHAAQYGRRYRMAHCGQPYIVTLARPHIGPQEALRATETGGTAPRTQRATPKPHEASQATTAARGAAAARAALAGATR
ncbi:hypothetical protein ACFYY8_33685 [Streptosporangium sp. NPDC001559]|uniref:hypothetical protein n=1 Tax=Streptosporangium sp. NPDC001559 TaxID=3366187 RepID=UPI0036EE7283